MLEQGKRYTISELMEAAKKSAQEFEPKFGDGVVDGNKTNNGKAIKDIQKSVSDYDGGIEVVKRKFDKPADRNKTTIDVRFNEVQPGKEWEDRVEAQVHGFPSVMNEENHEDEEDTSVDYSGNKEFYDWRKDLKQDRQKEEDFKVKAGIAGKPEKKGALLPTNESNTLKRLKFKRTIFENAQKAISKVPEEYKTDGNRFIMMDANGTEFLMECTIDKDFGYAKVECKKQLNEKKAEDELDRMRSLYGFNSSDYYTSADKSKENLSALHESIESIKKLESEGIKNQTKK